MHRGSLLILLSLAGLRETGFAFQEELRFAGGLTQEGFPNLARTVLARTLREHPEAESTAAELRIRILIAEKKFDEAGTQLAAVNEAGELRLLLAETAYRARQHAIAGAAYKKYFESVVRADESTLQAAFHYGELLEARGAQNSAEKIYQQVLKLPEAGKNGRPVKVKLARLLANKDPERAKKLCEEVQLGGLDLWFGQSVVIWSTVMQQKGAWEETTAVLETQLELLKQLEDSLEKQGPAGLLISPLSGARFLLGACYEHAGQKEAALTQFYNVYAKYGDSEWGPKAQERAQTLIADFKQQGKTVKIDLGANRARMEESRFRAARRLFFENQYKEAAPAYLDALNQCPEGSAAVTALRELTLCYIHLGDTHSAKTGAVYLGERFSACEAAADALLAAGQCALNAKQHRLAWWMYDRYLEFFPANVRAPAVLYSLAALHKQAGDAKGEEDHLLRLLQNYPDDPYAARALSALAWTAYEKEHYEKAAVRFEQVLKCETDPEKTRRARFALAESYRIPGRWEKAYETYRSAETFLSAALEIFGAAEETLAATRMYFEKSIFYQGTCLAKLARTEEAAAAFDRLIKTFPASEFVPQARLAQAAALLELKQYDAALAGLAAFGESSDRRFLEPALYYRGAAYFETGRHAESIQSLETLLNGWPESGFFFKAKLVQGRACARAGKNADAVRVLGDILQFATDDLMRHQASLELGRAQNDPAEKLASYQRVALLADPAKPEQAELIQQALTESLPLYLETGRPADLLTDCERLTKEFPMPGKTEELNSWRVKAREQLAQQNRTADSAD